MSRWSKAEEIPRNLILFGPAGTGKSHLINTEIANHYELTSKSTFRITFHPEYSHFEFFGQFKPCVAYEKTSSKILYPGQRKVTAAPQYIELRVSDKYFVSEDKRLNFTPAPQGIRTIYNITEQAEIKRESEEMIRQRKTGNVSSSETEVTINDRGATYRVKVYVQRPAIPLLRVRTKSDPRFVELLTNEFESSSEDDRFLKLQKTGEKTFEIVRDQSVESDEAESDRKPIVYYSFVPGPFLNSVIYAHKNPDEQCALIIEEINRGNCAAIFGDVFQLLDRSESGVSKYPITLNPEATHFLKGHGLDGKSLAIPENLSIIATMNIADQSLNALDVAFKRRWQMMYVGVEGFCPEIHLPRPFHDTKWEQFLKVLNEQISSRVSEDHVIGPFFFTDHVSAEDFASKLLAHLWFDVVRHERNLIFDPQISSFETILRFMDEEKSVFCPAIADKLKTGPHLKAATGP